MFSQKEQMCHGHRAKMLTLIFAMIILLAVVYIVILCRRNEDWTNSWSIGVNQIDDFAEDEQVSEWIALCNNEKDKYDVFALCYKGENNGEKSAKYLLYFPNGYVTDEAGDYSVTEDHASLFHNNLKVEALKPQNSQDMTAEILCVGYTAKKYLNNLKITYNHVETEPKITNVDYEPFQEP